MANKELADDEGTLFFSFVTSKDEVKLLKKKKKTQKTPAIIKTGNFIHYYRHQTNTLVAWTQRAKHSTVATSTHTHTPETFITRKMFCQPQITECILGNKRSLASSSGRPCFQDSFGSDTRADNNHDSIVQNGRGLPLVELRPLNPAHCPDPLQKD